MTDLIKDTLDYQKENPMKVAGLPGKSTLQAILVERKSQHGDFNDHARISQALKRTMWAEGAANWDKLTDTQREGLEMIQHKVARILAGNPNLHEHWNDIAGYATVTSERIVE